jgi:cytochrome bd-type quinol oxidase subunit 1
VAIYAVLHDQYVVRIEPRHFADYHPLVWGVTSPALQAAILAFCASIGPGFMLGIACVLAGWIGSRPRISNRFVIRGVLTVIVCAEIASLLSGWWVFGTRRPLYPEIVYPEQTLSLMITQTIQITCYLASALFSVALIAAILRKRRRMDHP